MTSRRIDTTYANTWRSAVMAATIAAAVAVVAAACGATSTRPNVSAARVAPARSAPAAPNPPIAVTMSNAQYGEILTNAAGFALYTYTADEPGGMGCDARCLEIWPPLLLPAGVTTPLGGTGVSGLGTFARGPRLQVTYRGLPLYTYVKDRSPGQVTGQDLVDPAGKWLLVTLNASPMTPPAPANAAQPATTQPSITHQAGAQAPVTGPPATHAPATSPPVTSPPATHPPVTSPPVTNPPVTQPPATSPPPPTTPPTTAPGLPSY